jgi:hypothetical protein
MSLERAIFVAAAVVAGLSLVKLMRRRQNHLTGLLRQYVGRQKEWALKRERAASLALKAAHEKSPHGDGLAIAELPNSNDSAQPTDSAGINASSGRVENRASA